MKTNILIDMLPFQHPGGVGGALSFTKTVYDALFEKLTNATNVYGAYDSTKGQAKQYNIFEYAQNHNITLLDISKSKPCEMIEANAIETFFIAFGQFYAGYNMSGISCKTIIFIHDIFDIERCDNQIDMAIHDNTSHNLKARIKRIVNLLSGRYHRMAKKRYKDIMQLYASEKTLAYTVSNYSANALKYYFPEIKKDIRVCYAPTRKAVSTTDVENPRLKELITSGKPYLFMVAANRIYKNPSILMDVFKRLQKEESPLMLLTLKYGKSINKKHTDIDYLSDSDMDHAYRNAFALIFPSYFEGFGYPPIEALACGTPTIASNVTSIPEILGDAGLYFSPFYPADLYRALHVLTNNHDVRRKQMEQRHKEIVEKQQNDLQKLIKEITE